MAWLDYVMRDRPAAEREAAVATVRALLGRLSVISVLHSESFVHSTFVWTRRVLFSITAKNGDFRPGQVPDQQFPICTAGPAMNVAVIPTYPCIFCIDNH